MDAMALSRITWQDLRHTPDDGRRREAIEGELHVTAAPSSRHQRISVELTAVLHRILVRSGRGTLFHAPGVEFPATSEGVQPDLVFVSAERDEIVGEDWIRGAPDLVVEILSPSTAERDRGVKLKLYRRQGVPQYWLVDPRAECVEVWRFDESEPRCRRYSDRLPVRVGKELLAEVELEGVFGPS